MKLQSGEVQLRDVSMALARCRMDDAIVAPTVTQLEREIGTQTVLTILLFELEKINEMFNANQGLKLKHTQCADIAVMLIEEFPHESIEDFVLAFRKGITGKYNDKLLRLDVQIIFGWVRSFLDEKSERIELLHKAEKEIENKPYTDEEKEKIAKVINESWVGDEIKRQKFDKDNYERFRAGYAVKAQAKRDEYEKRRIQKQQKDHERATNHIDESTSHDAPGDEESRIDV